MDVETLTLVAEGQAERTILDQSKTNYLGKVRVMTQLLSTIEGLTDALEIGEDGLPLKHTGKAHKVFKLKLPMQTRVGTLLFARISIDGSLSRKRKSSPSEGELEVVNPLAASEQDHSSNEDIRNLGKDIATVGQQTYQNYKSALKWWHTFHSAEYDKEGHAWPSDLEAAINKQVATYKRDIGVKKRRGIMPQKEGKSAYSLNGLIVMCTYLLKMRPTGRQFTWLEGLFAGLFQKFSVNTIGRSDNVDDVLLENLDMVNDAMTICFGTTKPDQAGEKTHLAKRIYANPFKPEICVFVALALYTWCRRRNPGDRFLFHGTDQNKRYYHILMGMLSKIPADIDLGCARADIGTHSNRKFAESTSTSKVDGPSRTHVCLRAGQSVGRSQDCYMFPEEDGDSLVGRTLAQLKFDADEFDVLPCHFGPSTLRELGEFGWNRILDGFHNNPPSFQRVIPILFATLVHHFHNGDLTRLLPAT